MSTNINTDASTRSMLDTTLQSITQLGATLNHHLEQERKIHSQINSLEYALNQLKQQQVTVKATISTIQRSIANMKEAEQELRRALSPMKRLPDDILLHIFRIIVQLADHRNHHRAATWTSPSNRGIQLRLGRVCRRWRTIINGNSSLWTTVTVRLYQPSEVTRNREHERVAHWKRAGRHNDQMLLIYDWRLDRHDALKRHLGTESIEWKAIHISPIEDPATECFGPYHSKEVTIYRNKRLTSRFFTPLMRRASVLVLYHQQVVLLGGLLGTTTDNQG
jgi:hypothetical protein